MRRAPFLCWFLLASAAFAQTNVLTVAPPDKVVAKIGSTAEVKLTAQMREGYHCNSNTPSDDYLIPLKLTWNPGPLQPTEVVYPKPRMEKYSFSPTPLSVFTGDFQIVTHFKVAATANPGLMVLPAKLRYQACNDRMCLAPKTVDITLPVEIVK